MRFIIGLSICSFLFLLSTACSSNSNLPVSPEGSSAVPSTSEFDFFAQTSENYGMLFNGTMEIVPKDNIIYVYERTESANYDITGFLASGCPGGCFRYTIVTWVDDVLTIDLEIENPTALQVYDLRMVFTNLHGKKVMNPDSYTNLFDPPGGTFMHPQIAFAKEDDSRAFPTGPGGIDNQTLELAFPAGSNPLVDFVIAASFPAQCQEPFEIFDIYVDSSLTPTSGEAYISVRFKDHQNDVLTAAIDSAVFNGTITFLDYMYATDRYTTTITNTQGAAAGDYTLLFGGMSPGSNVILYDFLTVHVGSDTLEFESPRVIENFLGLYTFTQGGKGINGYGDDIYLIYYYADDLGNQQVEMIRSEDGGNTFILPPTRVNSDDPLSIHISPSFDVANDGTIHAAWIRGDLSGFISNMEYARSFDGGTTFEPDSFISGFYFELYTDISVASNSKIHAIRNGAPGGVFNVYASASTDGGNSWGPDLDLSQFIFPDPSSHELFPVMDCDSNGTVYIAFMSDYNPEKQDEYGVYLSKSTDDGITYSEAVKINDYGTKMRLPSIVCDYKNVVHATWVDLENGVYDDIRYSYSQDGGQTFAPSIVVDDIDVHANEPVIMVDPNTARIYLLYKAGNMLIHYSDDGITWSESLDLGTTGTGFNMYVDYKSHVHISWADGSGLKYTRSL